MCIKVALLLLVSVLWLAAVHASGWKPLTAHIKDYEQPAPGEQPVKGAASCSRRTVYDGDCPIDKAKFNEIDAYIKAMVKTKEKLTEDIAGKPPGTGPACVFENKEFDGLRKYVAVTDEQRKRLCLWSGIGKGDGFKFVDEKITPACFRLEATVFGRYLVKNYPRDAEKTPDVCCKGFKKCHLPNMRNGKISPDTGILSESNLFHGLWAYGSRSFAEEIGSGELRAYFSSAGTTPRNGQPSKLAGETFAEVELPQLGRNAKKITSLKVFIANDPKNKPEGRPILDCSSAAYNVVKAEVEKVMKWKPESKLVACTSVTVKV